MEKLRIPVKNAKALLSRSICHTVYRNGHVPISVWFEGNKMVARSFGDYQDYRLVVIESERFSGTTFSGEAADKLKGFGKLKLSTDLHSE